MPDKELSAYAEKVASLPFVTNDGVSMTYGSAIEEICDVVQKQAQKVTRTGAVLSQPLLSGMGIIHIGVLCCLCNNIIRVNLTKAISKMRKESNLCIIIE